MEQNPNMETQQHDAEILDQFTRQAEPFLRRHSHRDDPVLEAMAECAAVRPQDEVLDVACGPGIISCFFAERARQVTGLDVVPAMLEKARQYQREQGIANVKWLLGSSTDLPFAADSFDRVVTRFSFHHFLEPERALREMARVARPGGVLLVCDVAPRPEAQESFNQWEILRDPSHTRALTEAEFEALGAQAGLKLLSKKSVPFERDFEDLLSGSFPREGDAERIRALFDEEVCAGTDRLGVWARRVDGRICITYPVLVFAWRT